MTREDRRTVLDIIHSTEMFTPDEVTVACELIDIYLDQPQQRDYSLVVAENEDGRVVGYMSYGPTPLTEGTYDLYWMAVASGEQRRGYGRELAKWLEKTVREAGGGRLILIETSSQPKYEKTRRFYTGLNYKEVSRIPDFYRKGDDRITYVKYLV
jgi:ribosomal protein S18 acetylase RimI-like enzyme